MPKETDIADAIGRILAHVHRSPPLDCDPSRVDELMAIYPRPPRGRSGAVDQVTLAMAGIIGSKPRHPQPLIRSNLPSLAKGLSANRFTAYEFRNGNHRCG